MVTYNREDILISDRSRVKKDLQIRAEDIRQMIGTPGWKHLKNFLEQIIEERKNNLEVLAITAQNTDDLKKLSDMAITIRAYKFLLNITDEFMKSGERKGGL
ncbi:MAG TPA: hypothetical protein VMV86_05955 [Methanosarcinales archaeon]|nr:hypothetical protein [Methanosarcinales archaeon]